MNLMLLFLTISKIAETPDAFDMCLYEDFDFKKGRENDNLIASVVLGRDQLFIFGRLKSIGVFRKFLENFLQVRFSFDFSHDTLRKPAPPDKKVNAPLAQLDRATAF